MVVFMEGPLRGAGVPLHWVFVATPGSITRLSGARYGLFMDERAEDAPMKEYTGTNQYRPGMRHRREGPLSVMPTTWGRVKAMYRE